MAKQSGLGWTTLSLDDSSGTPVVIKNDVTDFNFATPRGVQDITGVDKSANERQLLLSDFSADLKGVFNLATSHTALKTASSTSVARTLTLTVSGATLANEVLITDYAITRANNGALTFNAPLVLCDGTVPTWS